MRPRSIPAAMRAVKLGIDATLLRTDGQALGHRDTVVALLQTVFSGAYFGWSASGKARVEAARARGIEYPPVLAEILEAVPEAYIGTWEGAGYSIEFLFGSEAGNPLVKRLEVELRGNTPASLSDFGRLKIQTGWDVSLTMSPEAFEDYKVRAVQAAVAPKLN